jgi:membrane protease YdiL (CAAX protease family)
LVLFGAGLLGILSLIPYVRRQLNKAVASAPEPPKLPVPVMMALALFQSSALLAVAVLGGLRLAPRLGLRSHLASWTNGMGLQAPSDRNFRQEIAPAMIGAIITPVLIFTGEALFRPWTGEALAQMEEEQPRSFSYTLMGVLYGGITEELLMRWGVVSLVARLFWRQRAERNAEGTSPPAAVMVGAIVLAALLFGVGHLPAVAALVALTPALIVRTVLLNAAGGIVFGYLYWKKSLEAAMVAHGGSHVVLSLVQTVRRQ